MISLPEQPENPAALTPIGGVTDDQEFIEAVHIVQDMTRAGDLESMETIAGRRWVSRELDAALIAAVQGALDGNIVFLREGGSDV